MTDKRRGARQDRTADAAASSHLPISAHIKQLRAIKQSVARAAEHLSRKPRIRFSVTFAMATIEAYWSEIQRGHLEVRPLRRPFEELVLPKLDDSSKWIAGTLGRTAALVDPVTAGYFIGTTYAAAIPKELRSQLGIYYTPPAIAARLLDQAEAAGMDWGSCSVLDPACGGGAFLAPVAERIVKELSHLEPGALLDTLAERLRGFEIDPVAAWMSQVLLDAMVLPISRAAGRTLPVVVELRNTLAHDSVQDSFDLVIGNPPYGRITLSPRARARYAEGLYGHANLYGLFTDVALRWVKPGGVVAYVTPTSFLAGQYFKNLRRMLGDMAPPLTIDFIAERKGVFDEVLQETVLATYRRLTSSATRQRPRSASVTFVAPVDETMVRISHIGSFILPDDPSFPWLVPRDSAQDALIRRLRRMPDRLADWGYEVSTGPLVWNRHKSQLREHKGSGCLPLIWAEAVRSDGTFRLRATKTNHRQYFKPRFGDGWLVTSSSCVLVQRTTAKEQSRRLIAAMLPIGLVRDHGGAVVENHLNMLRPVGASPAVSPRTLAAFLNSAIADHVFRCFSGSVAVSAYELEALPLPPARDLNELDSAVQRQASRDVLDEICARLYGLSSRA
jgi:adenine-specific DNA-methyltransferase